MNTLARHHSFCKLVFAFAYIVWPSPLFTSPLPAEHEMLSSPDEKPFFSQHSCREAKHVVFAAINLERRYLREVDDGRLCVSHDGELMAIGSSILLPDALNYKVAGVLLVRGLINSFPNVKVISNSQHLLLPQPIWKV